MGLDLALTADRVPVGLKYPLRNFFTACDRSTECIQIFCSKMSRQYDSSSDEEGDYTITNVILGYASEEPVGDEISHTGGHPVSRGAGSSRKHRLTITDMDR